MLKWIIGFTAGAAVSAVAAYQLAYKPWRRQWEATPEEADRMLPGDDLIGDAGVVETTAVTIDAPPSAIWPWLLQMGYGRGGWYSYDAVDMEGSSAREILPEFQELEVGQLVPVAPDMGFRVDVLEPERALVLYNDSELVAEQGRAAAERIAELTAEGGELTPGLRVAGGLSQATMSDFRASWAFVLEPVEGGRTRLLERLRVWTTPGPAATITGPLMDFGIFLMTRKQLLGIKERVEMTTGSMPAIDETEVMATATT
jgi:hypothetical protein